MLLIFIHFHRIICNGITVYIVIAMIRAHHRLLSAIIIIAVCQCWSDLSVIYLFTIHAFLFASINNISILLLIFILRFLFFICIINFSLKISYIKNVILSSNIQEMHSSETFLFSFCLFRVFSHFCVSLLSLKFGILLFTLLYRSPVLVF